MPGTPILADTQAVALAVRRAPPTIRAWAHNGLITRKGTDSRGRALYDLDEAIELAASLGAPETASHVDNARDVRQHQDDCRSPVSLPRVACGPGTRTTRDAIVP